MNYECIYCGDKNKIQEEQYIGIKRCQSCGKRQQLFVISGKVVGVQYDQVQFVEDWLKQVKK